MRVRVLAILAMAAIILSGCHKGVVAALLESPNEMSLAENLETLESLDGNPTFGDKLHETARKIEISDLRASQLAIALAKSKADFNMRDAGDDLFLDMLTHSVKYSEKENIDTAKTVKFMGHMFVGGIIKSSEDIRQVTDLLDSAKEANDKIPTEYLMENLSTLSDFLPAGSISALSAYAPALISLSKTEVDPSLAAQALIIADAAVRHGGANGENSRALILSALREANPELDEEALSTLMRGGLFRTTQDLTGTKVNNPDNITNYEKISKYIQSHLKDERDRDQAYEDVFMIDGESDASIFGTQLSMSFRN